MFDQDKSALRQFVIGGVAAAGLLGFAGTANAAAIILNSAGDVALGIFDQGHLNVPNGTGGGISASNAGAVGLAFKFPDGTFRDATSPGCLCEGWGVSASGVSGFANVSTDGGVNNLTVDSFTSTASTATSSVHLTSTPGIKVTQSYAEAANTDRLFQDTVTISNMTGGTITDVRYVRVMDWDVPPTEFSEFVTIAGTATTTLLERSHDNGFNTANPLGGDVPIIAATADTDFTDSGPADHGAYFRFNFGDLADGEEATFSIFYGAATTEAAALAAIAAESIELFSLGQSNGGQATGEPATFVFGFAGVGGEPVLPPPPPPGPAAVPEPGTLALLGLPLLGLAGLRRRRAA